MKIITSIMPPESALLSILALPLALGSHRTAAEEAGQEGGKGAGGAFWLCGGAVGQEGYEHSGLWGAVGGSGEQPGAI